MRLGCFKFLGILTLCFVGATTFAQQEFMVNGVILENGSKNRIALAEITNTRNNYSVGSNDMGIFQLKSVIGDTLVVTKRGFNDKFVVLISSKDVVINLNRGNTLSEVVITGQRKKRVLDEIKQDFKHKGSFYAGKPPFLSFLFTPLTALYETFGRTPKNARRFNNYYVTEMQQTHIDQFFNRTLINKCTGLEGKELDNFMINYRPEFEKTKNWNVYDGTKWIMDSFKKYKDTLTKP
jgi:hypothetical protein